MRRYFTLLMLLFFVGGTRLLAQVNCFFTVSDSFGCAPQVINFQDQSSGGPTTYFWDFANGNTSNARNPSTSYPVPGIYNIVHIVSNGSSSDTMTMSIRVFQPASPDFSSIDNNGCASPCHVVNFTNMTIAGESPVYQYVWDFGDGSLPSQSLNASHCYNRVGTFSVTLVARDTNGCQVSKVMPGFVYIGNPPTASMTAAPSRSCTDPQTVTFTGTGSSPNGPVTFSWYFGNGGTSAQQNPTELYSNGIYNPMLIVTDSIGCEDTARGRVEITHVHAGFMAGNVNACAGLPVQFTDTSDFASSWSWDFGDGNTSTLKNPVHSYAANGTYTVTLSVSYNGCTDTHTETAYINVTPPVNFTISADDTANCTAPFTVNFSNTAVGAATYSWDFGDGGTSTVSNPSHTYSNKGTFTVTLAVGNANGCVNTQTLSNNITIGGARASFLVDSLHGCNPLTDHFTNTSTSPNVPITSYQWIFGDGGTSTLANPSHTYTVAGNYKPILIIQNANGCIDTMQLADTIKVGGSTIPNFIAAPRVQCVDKDVAFTDLSQGETPNTTYLWKFGDGSTSNLQDPTHSYSDTGFYNITLTVIEQGCSTSLVRNKYVQIIVPKSQFVFQFDCMSPTTVAFSDSSQGADSWLWEFGDGSTSNQQSPSHNYATQSNYTVTLIVTNNTTGCVDSSSQTLPIGTPTASFAASVTQGCAQLAVHFSDSSTFASSWRWYFGDGGTSTQRNPTHTYIDTGLYTVMLIINPGAICADTIVKTNYITVFGIKPHMLATPIYGCTPLTVAFADSSTSYRGSIISWQWDFGTGDTAVGKTTSYTYNVEGNYSPKMKITDSHGCSAFQVKNITAKHVFSAFTSDTAACPGQPIHFTNTSQNTTTYTWNFGDGTTSTLTNPDHAFANAGSYSITLISNSNYGCKDTLVMPNYMVIDTPKPDFYVGSNFAPCPPFPVQFYNSTTRHGLTWLWYFGDGDTSTTKEPLHVYLYPGDYTVTLIAFDSGGCSGSKTYVDMIRVRGPRGQFTVTPDKGCVPLTVSINATTQSTVSVVADLGDTIMSNALNVIHTYPIAGTYIPVYTLTDSLGCQVAYPIDTIQVGIIPYPNLPPDTTICKGNYAQFDLPLGDHFLWTSTPSPTFLSCDTCKSTVCMAPDTLTYIVTAITNLGCVAKDTITVNVDALPQIFPGVQYRICPEDTLQLSAGPAVSSAVWTPNIAISDTTVVNPLIWPADTITYRVTGINSTGCSVSRIVKIFPISNVLAESSLTDTLICDGGSIPVDVTVEQTSVKGSTFQWIPSRYVSSATSGHVVINPPVGDFNYKVIVSSGKCIPDTENVHIMIAAKPDVEAGDPQTVAVGTTVKLWAASHQSVSFYWTSAVDSFECHDCRRPELTVSQNQIVYVEVTNQYGCTNSDSVVIKTVPCDPKMVFVPNTFTPNNDGLNDKLFVRGIGLRSLDYLRIFDRWGDLVWETHDLNEGWDGYSKGKMADQATYIYTIKGVCSSGSTIEKSGDFTLLR